MTVDPREDDRPDPPQDEPLAGVEEALRRLADRVSQDQERAAFRESVIDRLHQENQELRRDQLATALEPVRARLFRLHEALLREARRWGSVDPPAVEHVAPLLDGLAEDVVEALGRAGVEPFDVGVGERFDPARHRPREAVPVADAGMADAVVEVWAPGFTSGERVVKRADVTVGRAADEKP